MKAAHWGGINVSSNNLAETPNVSLWMTRISPQWRQERQANCQISEFVWLVLNLESRFALDVSRDCANPEFVSTSTSVFWCERLCLDTDNKAELSHGRTGLTPDALQCKTGLQV